MGQLNFMNRPQQRIIAFGWGGWRPGAGRPRSNRRNKIVLHRKRPDVRPRYPVHVTLKLRAELHSLRTKERARVIRAAFVHLVIEADSNAQLSRGMQGFCIRVARALNKLAGRTRRGGHGASRTHSVIGQRRPHRGV